jgi:hypothetical protein
MNMRTIALSSLLLIVGVTSGNEEFYRAKLHEAQENAQQADDVEQEAMKKLWETKAGTIYLPLTNCPGYLRNWYNAYIDLRTTNDPFLRNIRETEYYNKFFRPFVVNQAHQHTLETGLILILHAIAHNKNYDTTTIKNIIDRNNPIQEIAPILEITLSAGIPVRMKIEDLNKGRYLGNNQLHSFVEEARAHKNQ